jgi:hypothetical protein
MSSRYDALADQSGPHPPVEAACSFCGESGWSAVWHGVLEILVCDTCATEILPCLLADAIWMPSRKVADAEQALTHFQARFWRAFALTRERSLRRSR